MQYQIIITLLIGTLCLPAAMANDVAKVIIMKGKAVGVKKDGSSVPLAKGKWLPEGVKVKTEPKSFVKLLFIDKSTMNVGPDSEMEITEFPKKEAGVISLLKGSVRSKVTKNYMDIKDKDKSKLFIKTKSAAMGVRGTDFQVDFNPATAATSLTTFEGAVAMVPLDSINLGGNIQGALDQALNSPGAIMVTEGMASNTANGQAAPPTKVPANKLQQMKNDPNVGDGADKGPGPKDEQAKMDDGKPKKAVGPKPGPKSGQAKADGSGPKAGPNSPQDKGPGPNDGPAAKGPGAPGPKSAQGPGPQGPGPGPGPGDAPPPPKDGPGAPPPGAPPVAGGPPSFLPPGLPVGPEVPPIDGPDIGDVPLDGPDRFPASEPIPPEDPVADGDPAPPPEYNICDDSPEVCFPTSDGTATVDANTVTGSDESIDEQVVDDLIDEINNEIQKTTVQFVIQ